MTHDEFLRTVAPVAQDEMRRSRILASLTIAQAILESNWGTSGLTVQANNLFGIKGTGPDGSVTMPTNEWNGNSMVSVNAEFRKYHSWDESIKDHTSLFTRLSRYQNLIGVTDYQLATRLVYRDGYATDPAYTNKLRNIIETFKLNEYDAEVLNEADVSPWAKQARINLMALGVTDGTDPKKACTREEVWSMLDRLHQALKKEETTHG